MNKKRVSLIIFIIGIVTLVAGIAFLASKLISEPPVHDGEYLVSIGEWVLKDGKCSQLKCIEDTKCLNENEEPATSCEDGGVIWNFTEIGNGTLTTNDHLNDYDFKWILEDGKLKIRTEWLYTLDDEFEYILDQNNNILTIKNGDEELEFVPLAS